MTRVATIAAAAALLAGCAHPRTLPYYSGGDRMPRWVVPGSAELARIHRVEPFRLTDQTGGTVTERDVEGKVYVASFFFTRCRQLCPIVGSGLGRVQAAFRDDPGVLLLSHSVAPDADSTAELRRWAHAHGAHAGSWRLLTGSRQQIARLAERSYFVELGDTTGNTAGTLLHTETLVLVDRHRRVRGLYDGTLKYDVAQLIADIRTLRAEGG
jgi:protein SCO1/2